MIKIFSTYTSDILFNEQNKRIREQEGGPLFYMEKILSRNKLKYEVFSQKAEIFINILKNNEYGELKTTIKQKKINNIGKNDIAIVSTVGSEWIFGKKIDPEAKIFLDVQGYVRIKNIEKFLSVNDSIKKVYCIKGNQEEIKKLPKNILKKQKKKILIVTKGERGAVIYSYGKKFKFAGKKIEPVDTIGAGDTFFASFILSFLKNEGDIEESGKSAIKEVEKFLVNKKRQ